MTIQKKVLAFYNPGIPLVKSSGDVQLTLFAAPGTLKYLQVTDNGQGYIGYSIIDLAPMPQNLWQSLLTPIGVSNPTGEVQKYFYPFIDVQLQTSPGTAGEIVGLPVATTFAAITRFWAGSYQTNAAGNIEQESYTLTANLYCSGQCRISVQNFNAASSLTIAVRALYEVEIPS